MPTDGTYGVGKHHQDLRRRHRARDAVEEGSVLLDEPVEPWLPELPHADEVTLAMLLGHTAGLGPWDHGDVQILPDLARTYTSDEALAMQLQVPPSGQPGERFTYTNAGYAAVGVLI